MNNDSIPTHPSEPIRPGEKELIAASQMDWLQVVFNQGPPCFCLMDDGSFCSRAKLWAGHDSVHKYRSLHTLLKEHAAAELAGLNVSLVKTFYALHLAQPVVARQVKLLECSPEVESAISKALSNKPDISLVEYCKELQAQILEEAANNLEEMGCPFASYNTLRCMAEDCRASSTSGTRG